MGVEHRTECQCPECGRPLYLPRCHYCGNEFDYDLNLKPDIIDKIEEDDCDNI